MTDWIKVRRGDTWAFDTLRSRAYITAEGTRSRRATTCFRCEGELPTGQGRAVTVLCRGAYRGSTKYLCAYCFGETTKVGVAGDSFPMRAVSP